MEPTYQPQSLTADQLSALSQEVKQALTALYGNRLDRVILYGSYARGDFHAESDVDYLVVLNDDEVRSGKEVRWMASIISSLALKYEVEVSVFPVKKLTYLSPYSPFYQAVKQEGVCT